MRFESEPGQFKHFFGCFCIKKRTCFFQYIFCIDLRYSRDLEQFFNVKFHGNSVLQVNSHTTAKRVLWNWSALKYDQGPIFESPSNEKLGIET